MHFTGFISEKAHTLDYKLETNFYSSWQIGAVLSNFLAVIISSDCYQSSVTISSDNFIKFDQRFEESIMT